MTCGPDVAECVCAMLWLEPRKGHLWFDLT